MIDCRNIRSVAELGAVFAPGPLQSTLGGLSGLHSTENFATNLASNKLRALFIEKRGLAKSAA